MTSSRRTFLISTALVPLCGRSAIADAGPRSRTFQLTYEATVRGLPDHAHALEVWLPWPQSDSNQTIERITVETCGQVTIGREPKHGNQALHARFERPRSPLTLTVEITATRRENAGRVEPTTPEEMALHLAPEPLVPLDGPVKALAVESTRGLTTDLDKARAIYDRVTTMMRYDKSGAGWGRGDALYACDARRGNCTDFHALLIGMARSVGLPARFAIGVSVPEDRGAGEVPGYHCWAEVYVRGRGWVPVDSSEGSKHPERRDYFFGHHDENRLEFSRGRHLTLTPAQHGPPLNFFVDPYAEVDGGTHTQVERKVTYRDLPKRS